MVTYLDTLNIYSIALLIKRVYISIMFLDLTSSNYNKGHHEEQR